jgi:hypothetical protein
MKKQAATNLIRVRPDVKKAIRNAGRPHETFDAVLRRLLGLDGKPKGKETER